MAVALAIVGTPVAADATTNNDFETEISWEDEPPLSVEHDEKFWVSTSGFVDGGETCIYEERDGSDNLLDCRDVGDMTSFEHGIYIDAESDLEAGPGEHAPLYAEVEEDGWFGGSDSTITISTYVEEDD